MQTARYVVGVLVVTFLPPGLLWWFVVHPFVAFWRRVGPRGTMISVGVFSIVFVGALMVVRNSILGPDLGLHWALVALAAALLVASIAIAARRKRYLTRRILAGLPELEADGGGGTLLSEGIYARIRHPRYVEVALGTLAYAAFANYAGAWIVALATVPVLHLIVLLEERELVERFGKEYERYRERVPRYVPRLRSEAGVDADDV